MPEGDSSGGTATDTSDNLESDSRSNKKDTERLNSSSVSASEYGQQLSGDEDVDCEQNDRSINLYV